MEITAFVGDAADLPSRVLSKPVTLYAGLDFCLLLSL